MSKPTYEELEKQVKELEKANDEHIKSVEKIQMLAHALYTTPDAVVISDMEGIIEYVNLGLLHMGRFDTDKEIIGGNVLEFLPSSSQKLFAEEIIPTILKENVWSGEIDVLRKDGSIFKAKLSGSIIRDKDGKPWKEVGIFRDITAHKKAEVALRESEEILRIRNEIAHIFITTPGIEMFGKVLNATLRATENKYGIFGYIDENKALVCPSMTRDIWDQCRISDKEIIFPRDEWGDSLWCRAIKKKKALYSNEPSLVPEGHIPITRNLAVPVIYEQEVIGLIHVANKITDYDIKDIEFLKDIVDNVIAPILYTRLQKDLHEKERNLAEEALKETNKSLEEMVYITSHDLQSPLVSMEGFATEVLNNYRDKLDEQGVHQLERIKSNTQRMHNLVLSLLDLSRLNTKRNPNTIFSTNKVIKGVLSDLSLIIEKVGVKVEAGEMPKIIGDKLRIEGIFRRLITNAATYGGKNIEIGFKDGAFFVKDDGIGIDEDQLENIFKPGERLKEIKTEGVGMGLTFSRKVINRHNGKLWAESDGEGKGATFYFEIKTKK